MFVHSVGSVEEPSGAVATSAALNNVELVSDRGAYNSSDSKKYLRSLGTMKPLTLFVCGSVAIAASLTMAASKALANAPFLGNQSSLSNNSLGHSNSLISQNDRAEQTCVSAARDRGLQVVDVTAVNETSGGAEVIMQVQQRRNGSSSVGCDYSNATHDVELYRIEDNGNSNNDRNNNGSSNNGYNGGYNGGRNSNDGWQNQSGNSIRNQSDAESIARQAVGDQLGIDNPNSGVVHIDNVQRNGDREWIVEGKANGAPFKVRLRSDDGSVQDFQLF